MNYLHVFNLHLHLNRVTGHQKFTGSFSLHSENIFFHGTKLDEQTKEFSTYRIKIICYQTGRKRRTPGLTAIKKIKENKLMRKICYERLLSHHVRPWSPAKPTKFCWQSFIVAHPARGTPSYLSQV